MTEQPVVTVFTLLCQRDRLVTISLTDAFPGGGNLHHSVSTVRSAPEAFAHPSDFNKVSLDLKPRNYATMTGRGEGNHLGSQKFESEIWKES